MLGPSCRDARDLWCSRIQDQPNVSYKLPVNRSRMDYLPDPIVKALEGAIVRQLSESL